MLRATVVAASAVALLAAAAPEQQMKPEATEQWTPEPPVVRPGPAQPAPPPSDAIVLFDGTNLDEWVEAGGNKAAKWTVAGGVMTVNKKTGNIETKRRFSNYQLHLEWRIPPGISGEGQGRGNSGLFMASTGGGDAGYELQILDSFNNKTYVNGMAGSVYKQFPPLANAMRPPGEWQTYDVVWHGPTFFPGGTLKSPATLTAWHNGVLIQDHTVVRGETAYIGPPSYRMHGPSPIKLQSHGDPSEPISFRNIWVRELPDRP
ncbi:MAG TPA: DUF1080 domain-containing protein [Allosphingosinicella sp.]|jgi:hypothetical protein